MNKLLNFLICIALYGCTVVHGEGPVARMIDEGPEPKTIDEGLESRIRGEGPEPKTIDEGFESRIRGEGSKPKMIDEGLESRMIDERPEPKTIDEDLESRMIGMAKKPKDYNEIELEPKLFNIPFVQVQLVELTEAPKLTSSTTTQDPAVVRESLCKDFGGKIINVTYCYEYVEGRELTQQDATTYCERKGGRLWVPNIWDPNLSFILFEQFPEIYEETYVETLWIGIERQDESFVSNTGQIYDDHPLLLAYLDDDYGIYYYYFTEEDCVVLYLRGNIFDLLAVDCDSTIRSFVCEYDV